MVVVLTGSGLPITRDGCRAPVERVTDEMIHPLPEAVSIKVYGKAGVYYIVCTPLSDGTNPCLTLARLDDQMYL